MEPADAGPGRAGPGRALQSPLWSSPAFVYCFRFPRVNPAVDDPFKSHFMEFRSRCFLAETNFGRITYDHRNTTPKLQSWVANFSVTTNILSPRGPDWRHLELFVRPVLNQGEEGLPGSSHTPLSTRATARPPPGTAFCPQAFTTTLTGPGGLLRLRDALEQRQLCLAGRAGTCQAWPLGADFDPLGRKGGSRVGGDQRVGKALSGSVGTAGPPWTPAPPGCLLSSSHLQLGAS